MPRLRNATGAPGKAIRLLVGLHYLKHAFNVSDESLLDRWVENRTGSTFVGSTRCSMRCLCIRRRSPNGVEMTTSVNVADVFVDKGYRGHDYHGDATIHLAGSSSRNLSRAMKRRRRRRSAVEPKIGHLKSDHRKERCFLKGLTGDAINAILAAADSNLLKLLRAIAHALIFWLRYAFSEPDFEKTGSIRTAVAL